MDELQHISKFDLQQLLRKDKETIKNIKQTSARFYHDILLVFNVSSALHFELRVKVFNNIDSEYTLSDYPIILDYFANKYDSENTIPCCGGFAFKNDLVGYVVEWSITDLENKNITLYSCIDNTMEENVISSTHLVSLIDKIVEV